MLVTIGMRINGVVDSEGNERMGDMMNNFDSSLFAYYLDSSV